jgi:hypothetical protein
MPGDFALCAWSLARIEFDKVQCGTLLSRIARECGTELQSFPAQHLATLTWALAKCNVRDKSYFINAGLEANTKFGQFKARELVMLLWAFAKTGQVDLDFFRQFATHRSLDRFTNVEVLRVRAIGLDFTIFFLDLLNLCFTGLLPPDKLGVSQGENKCTWTDKAIE